MNIMNIQPYRMTETPQEPTPVTAPSFGMAKIKAPKELTKKGAEAGAALLTAGAAALTGQVIANKSKRVTVGEIVNDSLKVLGHELPEMSKEELKTLDVQCDKALAKCDKYLKSKPSSHVEMYKELLLEEGIEIKKEIASITYMDIRDFYKGNIGDPDEPRDTSCHVNYKNMDKEKLGALNKQLDNFIEDCDKYACGNIKYELEDYKTILEEEKEAIKYIPKLDSMSFEEVYSLYTRSGSILDEAVFETLLSKYFSEFSAKNEEIEKMCSNYEKGCANYLHSEGNQKLLIAQEMLHKYGPNCLDDIE